MVQLAELKLHIRDEYTKNAHAKQRLKRHIAGAPHSTASAAHATGSASPAAPTSAVQLPHSTQTVGEAEREDPASSAGPAEGSLQAIADRLISMANDDHDEDDVDESFPFTLSFTLADLFDFSDDYWVKSSEATGNRGLQDELDLYDSELVDLDALGELDTDIDVDGMAEAVLTSQ
jgi:hypothetical protein